MAEYMEDRQAWYENIQAEFDRAADLAKLALHPNQLSARVKLYAPPVLQRLWVTFHAANARVVDNIALGNFHQDQWGTTLDDQACVPRAKAAAILMTAGIRATLNSDPGAPLALDEERRRILAEIKALPVHPDAPQDAEVLNDVCAEAFALLSASGDPGGIPATPTGEQASSLAGSQDPEHSRNDQTHR